MNPHFIAWVSDTVYAVSGIRPSIDAVSRASGYSLARKAASLRVKRNFHVCAKPEPASMRSTEFACANLFDLNAAREKRAGQ